MALRLGGMFQRIASGVRGEINDLLPKLPAEARKTIKAKLAAAAKVKATGGWLAYIAALVEILKLIQSLLDQFSKAGK